MLEHDGRAPVRPDHRPDEPDRQTWRSRNGRRARPPASRIRRAVGSGLLLDQGGPFHDAHVRPARPDEVSAWLEGTRRRDRASLVIGELLLAPGVPAVLDSGGLNRHTFMCGQSGSGKTYSLGLLLERVLAETTLRIVILDPNSDYVGLGQGPRRGRPDAGRAAPGRRRRRRGLEQRARRRPRAEAALRRARHAHPGCRAGARPDRRPGRVRRAVRPAPRQRGRAAPDHRPRPAGRVARTRAPSSWACGRSTWASSTGRSGAPRTARSWRS